MTMAVYAVKTLAEFKDINPNEDVLWQLLGEDFPSVEDLCDYYYDPTSTLVGDDVEVITPNSSGGAPGRWLRCDMHYMQPDWNATSGARFIQNKPTIPTAQVQSDWAASTGVASIANKPTIPNPQVQSDWAASSGVTSIANKPSIPAAQVQSDWSAVSGLGVVLNKPTIPAAQVNADWNASSGAAAILNKPTIPTVNAVAAGAPNTRTVALATAYQATDPTAPAVVTVNLSSVSSISLSGAVNNEGEVVIGSTNGVAAGTGTKVGAYKNTMSGTLVIGLNLSNTQGSTVSFVLPAGWYFAVRQTVGTGLTVTSAFDQKFSN